MLILTNDIYGKYKDFDHSLCMQSQAVQSYSHTNLNLIDFLKLFKKNKRNINLKYPLSHYLTVNNFLYRIMLDHSSNYEFVITNDWNFVIGYEELKTLYRWIFKNYPLIYDNKIFYYKNMPYRFKRMIDTTNVKVRIYNDNVNINDLIKIYFGHNTIKLGIKGEKEDVKI